MVNNLERYLGKNIVRYSEDFLDFEKLAKIKIPGTRLVRNSDHTWVLARPLRAADLKDPVFVAYISSEWKDEKELNHFVKSSER